MPTRNARTTHRAWVAWKTAAHGAAPPRRSGMSFDPPPNAAAWLHHESRRGFEVTFFDAEADGWRIDGRSSAVEEGNIWVVDYTIGVDAAWTPREGAVPAPPPS